MAQFKVITLCGSTRFKEDYIRVLKELTLAGNIVACLDTKEMMRSGKKE